MTRRRPAIPALAACAAALVLAGCGPTRAERIAAQNAADHAHCLELGFEEGTVAYGNCRLKLREIRAEEAGRGGGDTHFGVGIGVGIGL